MHSRAFSFSAPLAGGAAAIPAYRQRPPCFLGASLVVVQAVAEKIRFAWEIKHLLNTFINVKITLITDEMFFIKFEDRLA